MKISFMGTSHGVPAADRYCSMSMIEAGDGVYFIDGGAPVIDLLLRRGVDLDKIRAMFTTHLHGDHVNGVLAFADLLNWYFKSARAEIYLTEQRGLELFKALIEEMESEKMDEERVQLKLMTSEFVYEDENIRVTPLPTQHMAALGRPAYSYLVEEGGRKVLFSGDLSGKLERRDFPAYALENEVDVLVCEMAHFGVEEVLPYLERCRAKKVLFNHVFTMDKIDKINALNGRFGYEIRALEDGDEIEV